VKQSVLWNSPKFGFWKRGLIWKSFWSAAAVILGQASVLLSVALPSGLFNHGLYLENARNRKQFCLLGNQRSEVLAFK